MVRKKPDTRVGHYDLETSRRLALQIDTRSPALLQQVFLVSQRKVRTCESVSRLSDPSRPVATSASSFDEASEAIPA
jgi:hypothetical protein